MDKAVNEMCPVCGMDAEPGNTTKWQAQTVAFCSRQCISDWNKLSDMDKRVKLSDATSGEQEQDEEAA